MRKKFLSVLLLAVLVTLSACSQKASPTLEPTPTASITQAPVYPPPAVFKTASVWKSAPFGDKGGALMFMSDIMDGVVSFKVYVYQYVPDRDGYNNRIALSIITATAEYDGENYHYSLDRDINGTGIRGVDELTGSLMITEKTATIEYHNGVCRDEGTVALICDAASPGVAYTYEGYTISDASSSALVVPPETIEYLLPTTFMLVPEDEAERELYALPLFMDEIILPFTNTPAPEDLEKIMGTPVESEIEHDGPMWGENKYDSAELSFTVHNDKAGKQYYYIWNFTSSDPNVIPEARGVRIGNDVTGVISHFRCEYGSCEDLLASAPKDGEVTLYGIANHTYDFGKILFVEGKPTEIWYASEVYVIKYHFDERGYVESIEYMDCGY